MSLEHVGHTSLVRFADERVNLKKDRVDRYRGQVNTLRDRLDTYLAEHPEFALRKMLISGSLAKGTALSTLNDIDVACYISGGDAPRKTQELINYLATRLRKAFPNFKSDQVTPNTYSVTVSFVGSGLDVDIVPILYEGDPDWYGDLVSQEDGSFLRTNIPFHLTFCRERKKAHPKHFAQVVRLVKYWARRMKAERDGFRLKSFMVEMIMAHLADGGADFRNYPEALQAFFTYILTTNLDERITFSDFYGEGEVGNFSEPIQIIDPVNPANNVSKLYTKYQRNIIVEAAEDAGDAIEAAAYATTKEKTVYYWQKVFGPLFQG